MKDEYLSKFLDTLPEQSLIPKKRGLSIFYDWYLLSEDERKARIFRLKKLNKAVFDFKDRRETRRKEYVDEITQLSLELVRNTSYIVTDTYTCPDCGGNEFHVAETIAGRVVRPRNKPAYKLYEITMSCMRRGHCTMQRRIRHKEEIKLTMPERLVALGIRAPIMITLMESE